MSWRINKRVPIDATKIAIIATVGPPVFKSKEDNSLAELIEAGVTAFRINFSHVTEEGKLKDNGEIDKYNYQQIIDLIDTIRVLEENLHLPIPIIMDLKGPEIRVKRVVEYNSKEKKIIEDQDCALINESSITYLCQIPDNENDAEHYINKKLHEASNKGEDFVIVYVTYYEGNVLKEIKGGNRIRIDDGRIELKVLERDTAREYIKCRVVDGGLIKTSKSVNLPDRKESDYSIQDSQFRPKIIERDLKDIRQRFHVDFIAQSFVRSKEDIELLYDSLTKIYNSQDNKVPYYPPPKIIAKIETKYAVKMEDGERERFKRILEDTCTFGIMIGRGDLGGELPGGIPEVPGTQKDLIELSNRVGKPVIVATQMLESMIKSPVPTRAEAQDIWSAIRQGADAVMLSGETAGGKNPKKAVKIMKDIIRKADLDVDYYRERFNNEYVTGNTRSDTKPKTAVEVVGYPVVALAEQSKSPYILTYATKGWSATKISRFRPKEPKILAFTSNEQTARILRLLYGLYPVLMESTSGLTDLPRERSDVIRLCRLMMNEICENDSKLCDFSGKPENCPQEHCDRFVVATFAHEKPPGQWDDSRVLLVFKRDE